MEKISLVELELLGYKFKVPSNLIEFFQVSANFFTVSKKSECKEK